MNYLQKEIKRSKYKHYFKTNNPLFTCHTTSPLVSLFPLGDFHNKPGNYPPSYQRLPPRQYEVV